MRLQAEVGDWLGLVAHEPAPAAPLEGYSISFISAGRNPRRPGRPAPPQLGGAARCRRGSGRYGALHRGARRDHRSSGHQMGWQGADACTQASRLLTMGMNEACFRVSCPSRARCLEAAAVVLAVQGRAAIAAAQSLHRCNCSDSSVRLNAADIASGSTAALQQAATPATPPPSTGASWRRRWPRRLRRCPCGTSSRSRTTRPSWPAT